MEQRPEILLITDDKTVLLEMGSDGKFSVKSNAWEDNKVLLEGVRGMSGGLMPAASSVSSRDSAEEIFVGLVEFGGAMVHEITPLRLLMLQQYVRRDAAGPHRASVDVPPSDGLAPPRNRPRRAPAGWRRRRDRLKAGPTSVPCDPRDLHGASAKDCCRR